MSVTEPSDAVRRRNDNKPRNVDLPTVISLVGDINSDPCLLKIVNSKFWEIQIVWYMILVDWFLRTLLSTSAGFRTTGTVRIEKESSPETLVACYQLLCIIYIQDVPGGMCQTSGGCSLC